jgi:hypothetical protein
MELPTAWHDPQWHRIWADSASSAKADGRSLTVDLAPDASVLLEAPAK